MALALVTGGSSGIGLATARALVARGDEVVVADVKPPPDDLEARHVRADVRASADWAAVVEATGPELSLAFLNAGVASATSDVTTFDDAEYERICGIDIGGVVLGTRAVAPVIAARGGGAIVATASLAGLIAFAPDPLYTMAKHAVVGWVRASADQLAAKGVTINAICPGLTDTAIITSEMRAHAEREAFAFIDPTDIARAVLERFDDRDQTGGAWVCQLGREPMRYRYRGVPGPAGGARPPAELAERER